MLDGDPAPDGGTFDLLSFPGVPLGLASLDAGAGLAFHAFVSGGAASQGVFLASGGAIAPIAREGDPAPGTASSFANFLLPSITASGEIVFVSEVAGVGNGVFRAVRAESVV